MNKCKMAKINTTVGEKYLVVTASRSKEFKTENGAKKWIINNNYEIVK